MTPQKGDDLQQDKLTSKRKDADKPRTLGGSGFPFLNRSRMMGSSGLQAASIGWVMAGCVFLGYFAGAWLDGHFKTQFWTPILVLLGVAAGFREMFVTLNQLQKSQKEEKARAKRNAPAKKTASQSSLSSADDDSDSIDGIENKIQAKAGGPKRLFSVPPPPSASFDVASANREGSRIAADAAIERQNQLDAEEILRALQENSEDEVRDDTQLHEP